MSINLVDKDVQSMLLPLNLMQYIAFCPKYCIKNNFISINSLFSNFISFCGLLIFLSSFLYRNTLIAQSLGHSFTVFMYITAYFDFVYYCCGYVMNFIVGIMQTKNSVNFVLTFQNIHRFLNNETYSRNFKVLNWIIVILTVVGQTTIFAYFNITVGLSHYFIYISFIITVFDFNIIYATRLLGILENKLLLWSNNVLDLREIGEIYDENYCRNMYLAYVDILKCYELHKVCFQEYICFYITETFLHSLICIQVSIEMCKMAASRGNISTIGTAILSTMSVLLWILKDLFWQLLFCRQCEKFYSSMENVPDYCTLILKTSCSESVRRLCKNVRRVHRARFSKLRVCSLFDAGAALQLSLMVLLADYTIVLLQFAFL
ncbi:hypothetical protein B5X24_HaOG200860 [Helicoverpa armigera]|uniref:Gustatory receptor n=1 Tax=Helicoverpa armigera TaxID=29058 RepID=A0A2W1BKG8_HELAM|nr:hypothetical protein B5X24_HaOG200860 [Helicoverpa armigera]